MAAIQQLIYGRSTACKNPIGKRPNENDTRWTYFAEECASAGDVYKFEGNWYYVAVDTADLKNKMSFWCTENPPEEQIIQGVPVTANQIVTTRITDMAFMFCSDSEPAQPM